MKEYTVREFVYTYEKCLDEDKMTFVHDNIKLIKYYVSFVSKVNLCDLLIDTTYKDKFGNIRFDSATKDMLYKLNLINMYTNINVEFGNEENPLYDQYDLLQKYGLVRYMIGMIPIEEQKEFKDILDKKVRDFKSNNCTTSACINKHAERIGDLGAALLNPLIEEFDKKLPDILNNMNKKDLEKLVKRVIS